jgi:hypothetical protein
MKFHIVNSRQLIYSFGSRRRDRAQADFVIA